MLEAFFEDLAEKPEDWQVRGVFADWCEDNGKPELAECLRWMIRRQKRPYHGSGTSFTWFNADTIRAGMGDPESDLPGRVYDRLSGGTQVANHRSYATLREAEEALYAAWEAARKKGWKPDKGS
jgi:uncharacterized protein (TIGR02996 family)